jgi:maleate isomerase
LEQELRIPIYDTISTVVPKSLRIAGVDSRRVSGWGSFFVWEFSTMLDLVIRHAQRGR